MKRILSAIVIMFLAVTVFSGCVQQQQQPEDQLPPVKTIEDIAVQLVTLLMENNYTGVYGFFNTSYLKTDTHAPIAMLPWIRMPN